MIEFADLPPLAQAKRYRALAQDARNEAKKAIGQLRESYILSSERWELMAAELEDNLDWGKITSKP